MALPKAIGNDPAICGRDRRLPQGEKMLQQVTCINSRKPGAYGCLAVPVWHKSKILPFGCKTLTLYRLWV